MIHWIVDLYRRLRRWRRDVDEPFDLDCPEPPDSQPAIHDHDLWCPDTQPTSPGALDTLPGRLE